MQSATPSFAAVHMMLWFVFLMRLATWSRRRRVQRMVKWLHQIV